MKNLDKMDEGALATLNGWVLKVQDDKDNQAMVRARANVWEARRRRRLGLSALCFSANVNGGEGLCEPKLLRTRDFAVNTKPNQSPHKNDRRRCCRRSSSFTPAGC